MTSGDGLATAVKMWPTPRAQKTTNENEGTWLKRKADGKVSTPPLSLAVRMFPSPKTRGLIGGTGSVDMLRKKVEFGDLSHEEAELMAGCRIWPTPCAMEPSKNVDNYLDTLNRSRSERGGGKGPNLATAVKMWPTPQSTFLKSPREDAILRRNDSERKNGVPLSESVYRDFPDDTIIETTRLNPDWVELLMGWPIGWSSRGSIDMDEFWFWANGRLQHGWEDGTWERDVLRVCAPDKETIARLKSIGNGQVPQCAAIAWQILTEGVIDE